MLPQSVFWHNIWKDCGEPHSGVVADIMRKTRARYHAAVRQACRNQTEIINNRIAAALADNNNRQFWSEIKHIHRNNSTVCDAVDGKCDSHDIANLFASKYRDLYTNVAFDDVELQCIRNELKDSLTNFGAVFTAFVSNDYLTRACNNLKPGKRDIDTGLSTDHFINASDALAPHLAMPVSGLLPLKYELGVIYCEKSGVCE